MPIVCHLETEAGYRQTDGATAKLTVLRPSLNDCDRRAALDGPTMGLNNLHGDGRLWHAEQQRLAGLGGGRTGRSGYGGHQRPRAGDRIGDGAHTERTNESSVGVI
jgi:hypothetical protein